MPNKKSKQQAKKLKREQAAKRDLREMRMKLLAAAQGKPPPELPPASVRLRKSLKNRTNL
jgi:hypothetical protein